MSESSATLDQRVLPLVGFRYGQTFKTLRHNNPFLFRVWTENQLGCLEPHGFFARRRSNLPPQPIWQWHGDVVAHVENTPYGWPSPFISTTYSLFWAIWWAVEKNTSDPAQIYISIIRAADIDPAAAILAASVLSEREQPKAWGYTNSAQEVLVVGQIAAAAIVASIRLQDILNILPPWYITFDSMYGRCKLCGAQQGSSFRMYAESLKKMEAESNLESFSNPTLSLRFAAAVLFSSTTSIGVWKRDVLGLAIYLSLFPRKQDERVSVTRDGDWVGVEVEMVNNLNQELSKSPVCLVNDVTLCMNMIGWANANLPHSMQQTVQDFRHVCFSLVQLLQAVIPRCTGRTRKPTTSKSHMLYRTNGSLQLITSVFCRLPHLLDLIEYNSAEAIHASDLLAAELRTLIKKVGSIETTTHHRHCLAAISAMLITCQQADAH